MKCVATVGEWKLIVQCETIYYHITWIHTKIFMDLRTCRTIFFQTQHQLLFSRSLYCLHQSFKLCMDRNVNVTIQELSHNPTIFLIYPHIPGHFPWVMRDSHINRMCVDKTTTNVVQRHYYPYARNCMYGSYAVTVTPCGWLAKALECHFGQMRNSCIGLGHTAESNHRPEQNKSKKWKKKT